MFGLAESLTKSVISVTLRNNSCAPFAGTATPHFMNDAPASWRFTPASQPVKLAPGETVTLEFTPGSGDPAEPFDPYRPVAGKGYNALWWTEGYRIAVELSAPAGNAALLHSRRPLCLRGIPFDDRISIDGYLADWNDREKSREVSDKLIAALEAAEQTDEVKYILDNREFLAKKSVWAVGGDGWAYDIGFGGIDHVMAQNQDVNLLVLDTEVYSNTGGQSSKATPTSATAKFAASGKKVAKKDLGAILMQYEYVYVAQVAMGADQAQTLKALREAESYDGPSIVICYCPCLEQHIKAGMGTSQDEMKKAVECGYWHLYRYDPRRIAEGKNPFQLDSKEPDTDKVMDFLMGENRFASLKNNFPDQADALYAKEVEDVKSRYARYKKLAED